MPRERITACLIVQDEQEHLPAALASVAFCDEIVVVDGGSRDRTVEIARAAGAVVIESPWPGYAIQRNVALDAATSEWVVEVDADERLCPRLQASIQEMLLAPPPGIELALCPLRHRFLGRLLGPSAKYPAYRSRIFRPASYRHDERREVHEGVQPRERPVVLEGDLEHELADGLGEALRDMWSYARLDSRHLTPPSARGYLTGIVVRPLAKLVYRTLVDGGWRDGWRGMLKISLDVVSDALVWVLVLARRQPAVTQDLSKEAWVEGEGEDTTPGHFGRRRIGHPKILALAPRGRSGRAAREWLQGLQAQGMDVVLVTDEVAVEGDIPLCTVTRFRPLAIMRAIDLETQVRELDAVVAFGRRARIIRRLLPSTLRPVLPGMRPEDGIERCAELIRRLLTPSPGR
ncbi:MAG TPA: glycosyltransferase family 2 protein [Solirubrobacteraceae bacterium]